MGAHMVFVIDDPAIWDPLPLEGTYWYDGILPIQLYSPNQSTLILILIGNYIFYHILHKVQNVRLNGGLLEGEVIVYLFYIGCQGISEVDDILWIWIGYFWIVEQLVWKKLCLW